MGNHSPMEKPLAIDLFCGKGGWTSGLLAKGWDVVGFDIENMGGHPAQLVLQDVLTLHGSQFKDADLIVASPPCQCGCGGFPSPGPRSCRHRGTWPSA